MSEQYNSIFAEFKIINEKYLKLEYAEKNLQNKCEHLSKENFELVSKLKEKENLMSKYQSEMKNSELEKSKYTKLKDELQHQLNLKIEFINELQKKEQHRNQEILESKNQFEQLVNDNGELQKGIENFKNQINEIEFKSKLKMENLQKKNEEMRINLLKEKQTQFDNKLFSYKNQFEEEIKLLKEKVANYQQENIFYKKEKEFAESRNKEISAQLEKTKFELTTIQEDFEQEIQELEEQVETYKTSYINPEEFKIKFQAERSQFEMEILQYQSKIKELEAGVSNLQNENKRLGQLTNQRLKEMESFKLKMGINGEGIENIDQLKLKIKNLRKENNDLESKMMKLRSEKSSLVKNLTNLKGEIDLVRSENYQIEESYQKSKKYIEELESEINSLKNNYKKILTHNHQQEGDKMMGEEKIMSLQLNLERYLN